MKKYMKLDKKVDVGKAADLFKEIDKWEDEHDDHQVRPSRSKNAPIALAGSEF